MKVKSKFLIISIALLFALSLSAVCANENASDISTINEDTSAVENIVDNNNDLSSNENGNADLGVSGNENKLGTVHNFTGTTFSELQSEIDNAEVDDIIVLNNDVVQNGLDNITILKSVKIEGNGHIINANHGSVFYASFDSGYFSLNNITFKNCACVLYTMGITCNITNCNFINNTHSSILFLQNTGFIYNCNFINNSVNDACIYFLAPNKLKVSVINHCSFINNRGGDKTSCILTGVNNQCYITYCNFTNNSGYETSAVGLGLTGSYTPRYNSTIAHCIFRNNRGNQGGALVFSLINSKIINITFINNTAYNYAAFSDGARSVNQPLNNIICNCTIINNTSIYKGVSYVVSCNVNNCTFINNKCHTSGILISIASIVSNCNFMDNDANFGAVTTERGDTIISNSNFTNNYGASNGAIGAKGKNITITGCNFINNTGRNGGAIATASQSSGKIENCRFENNTLFEINLVNNWAMNNNKFSYNHVNIIILDNATTLSYGVNKNVLIKAIIKDDKNNTVIPPGAVLSFVLPDGNIINATVNTNTGVWTANYKFNKTGIYPISAIFAGFDNYTIYNGNVEVKLTEFMLLQKLIDEALPESVINLNQSYTYMPEFDTNININKALTINGNGYTINGVDTSKTFYIHANNVTFKNITFTNSQKALDFDESTNACVSDCKFISNNANYHGAGVIYFRQDCFNASVINCEFKNSTVGYEAGIIYFDFDCSNASVVNCEFLNTTSGSGTPFEIYMGYYGSVYFKNNKLTGIIFVNHGSKVLSETKIIILDNSTVFWPKNNASVITAVITDDNNNIINTPHDADLKFVLEDGTVIRSSCNFDTGVWSAEYAFTDYGDYIITVTYDDKTLTDAFVFNATVRAMEFTKINVTTQSIIYGENATIIITLPGGARGVVILNVSGNISNIVLDDSFTGTFAKILTGLTPDTYNIKVNYTGSTYYKSAADETTLTVGKAKFDLNVSVVEGNASVLTRFDVGVPSDFNGNVTITVNNNTRPVTIFKGKGNITVSLSHGDYEVSIKTLNSTLYNDTITTRNIHITDKPELSVSCNHIVYGENATIIITLPDDACGSIKLTVGKNNYTIGVNGSIEYNISGLTHGNYTVKADYSGDSFFEPASADAILIVNKKPTTPEEINVTNFGNTTVNNASLVIKVPENITGNITVTVDGKNYTSPIINGTAVVNLTDITPGTHNACVNYSGDDNNERFAKNITLTINKAKLDLEVSIIEGDYNNPTVIGVGASKDYDGKICVKINSVVYEIPLNHEKGSISLNLTFGNYTVEVSSVNSTRYDDAQIIKNISIVDTRTPLNPNSTFEVSSNGTVSTNGSFVVNVDKNLTGNITVDIDGNNYTSPINNGTALFDLSKLAPGKYKVIIIYRGDKNYQPTNTTMDMTIPEPVIALVDNKDISVLYSGKDTYTIRVLASGKNVANGEEVIITFNGVKTLVKTINGMASLVLNTNLKIGKYTITADYKNKKISNIVTIKNIINAKKLKKLKKSKKVNKVKVSLAKVDGKFLKGKKLTLKLKGKKVASAKTNKKGVATFKIKKNKIKKLKNGKVKATVTYGKDVVSKKIKIVK